MSPCLRHLVSRGHIGSDARCWHPGRSRIKNRRSYDSSGDMGCTVLNINLSQDLRSFLRRFLHIWIDRTLLFLLPRGVPAFALLRTMGSSYDSSIVMPQKEASASAHRHQDSLEYAENGDEYHDSIHGHTQADQRDMSRMGKIQELRRNYRPLSALAFTVILQGVWEVLLT